ncbi:FAD-dependent oxidoreductase [Vulcanisaeta souniana]|uniref:FAD-dependent oxidoreductase n=1 Tax=Vulcanisaeta souniana TaxID=164452 RepID=UPI0006CF30C3|nr:FAD-dependent oxidoreductase [Vulcanisaeta souniana]
MKRVAIVGASFAGAEVANKLAKRLRWELARGGDVEISVFDKDNDFLVQAMYPLIVFNSLSEEHAKWRKSELLDPRVKFYHGPRGGELVSIDLRNRELGGFADGSKYNYDYLVIATGLSLRRRRYLD